MGIYERKQECKKTRKQEFDQESDPEKKKVFSFFSWLLSWPSSCFLALSWSSSCFLFSFIAFLFEFLFSFFLDRFHDRVLVFLLSFINSNLSLGSIGIPKLLEHLVLTLRMMYAFSETCYMI